MLLVSIKMPRKYKNVYSFLSMFGHDRQTFAYADERIVALVYGMTADIRYNEQKLLVFGKDQGYIPNRHTKVLQVKVP